MFKKSLSLVCLCWLIFSCSSQDQRPVRTTGGVGSSAEWLIPQQQVYDGGPGKDGIPAISDPEVISMDEVDFLNDDDLVIGFSHNGKYRAYPHNILDWHEIINDDLSGQPIAVTYCPLTGSGIGWNRVIAGIETTFGVSGLLYNTNLIPYDRYTDSNWSQLGLKCVNGTLKGNNANVLPLIETTWKTWKEMFPESTVVSTNTGFSRSYGLYPYGNYKTNHSSLLFPVSPMDDRLPAKERVLAIIDEQKAKVYRFSEFENGTRIIVDEFADEEVIVIGNLEKNFISAFRNSLNNTKQNFVVNKNENQPIIFNDSKGNGYDFFGNVIEGPDQGSRLLKTNSFMAYWFSIGAFYSNPIIYNFQE